MPVELIGIGQILSIDRIAKANVGALRIGKLHVLRHAACEISMRAVDSRIQNRDGYIAAADGHV